MHIKSFAKINLGLEVIRKREDGYHEIRTLFQSIDFSDELQFRLLKRNIISLSGNTDEVPWTEENLIHRAARLLKSRFNPSGGVGIHVIKNIPVGKGLGGGSSNAAMTLYALNRLWGLGLSTEELMDFGGLLGADVPYFLRGGMCLGSGRGDELVQLADLPVLTCVLALPPESISTALVYGHHRIPLTSGPKDSKINKFLDSRDFGFLENDLEETVFRLFPPIIATKRLFRSVGSELSLVSGTGSAVFGLFNKRAKAEEALSTFKKEHTVLLVETLPRGLYWNSIQAGV